MSVIDSLIRGIKFNSDDDIEDDGFDGMDDVYEDEMEDDRRSSRRPSVFGRKSSPRDEDDYDEDRSTGRSAQSSPNLPVSRRKQGGGMQVRIIRPSSFDQAKQITDTLLSHRTVLLNLEGLDVNTAQRIVDFASGSCYALHGNFMKISHFIIVITPEDVSISGDISMEGEALAGLSALSGLAGAAAQGGSGDMFSAGANPFVQGIPPYQA